MRRRWALSAAACALAVGTLAPISAAASPATPAPTKPADAVTVTTAPEGERDAAAARLVAGMTLEQKAASVVMGHIPTTDPDRLAAYMRGSGIGGFILMGANIPGSETSLRKVTAALTVDPALPPLIAIDEEGGDITRLPWDGFPGAATLKGDDVAATKDAFLARGALVQRSGANVNFGVVADVTDERGSFIYRRSLGTNPAGAADRVAAAVAGEQGQTLSTLKHFPGHGAAAGDSHATIPTTSRSKAKWQSTDAPPFASGITGGAELLMFGHLRFSAVDKAPASLSAAWHAIARDELGFTGVAITDDLGMLQASGSKAYRSLVKNAVSSLVAGNDMVLAVMFSDADSATDMVRGIVAAVGDGTLSAERLDEAATRVTALRLKAAAGGRGLLPCADCTPAE
ncbi:MAG: glycoside hydrolase family 3 protein [Candidatus Cloacimonetes bacterium]|nr:glycoside hydrolase family 3 protein [Candidatus Cloacimonadota bacterium]